jgi:hypothetical protein
LKRRKGNIHYVWRIDGEEKIRLNDFDPGYTAKGRAKKDHSKREDGGTPF